MAKTKLRTLGADTILNVPRSVLAEAGLEAGDTVDVVAVPGGLSVGRARPRYTLEQLCAEHVASGRVLADEDRQWLDAPPVGRELI